MAHIDQKMNRLALEKSPYLRHHADESRGLVSLGRRSF